MLKALLPWFCVVLRLANFCSASQTTVVSAILASYDKISRPVHDESTVITVSVLPSIESLIAVIESEETIKFLLYLITEWSDEFLVWNPAEHNGTSSIMIPSELIWLPDMAILSSIDMKPALEQQLLQIDCNGTVVISRPLIVSNYCRMKIDQFPFDEQVCLLNIGPWMYNAEQVFVVDSDIPGAVAGNSEWRASPMVVETNDVIFDGITYRKLHYFIRLKRNPAFYIWVLILPTFIITALCVAGIFTPTGGEHRESKVELGLTTLMTVAVILGIVSQEMPKGSTLPLLGVYVLIEIIICTVALILAIAIMKLHHEVSTRFEQPPAWIVAILFPTQVNNKSKVNEEGFEKAAASTYILRKPSSKEGAEIMLDLVVKFNETMEEIKNWIKEKQRHEEIEHHWMRIFDRIDTVLLVIFEVINVTVFFWILA